MTPESMGWQRCMRCGCHRPESTLRPVVMFDRAGLRMVTNDFVCRDDAVCAWLRGEPLKVVAHPDSPVEWHRE